MLLRDTSRRILRATLDQLQVPTVMQRQIRCNGKRLHVGGTVYATDRIRRIKIVSAGKAAVPMAASLMDILGPHVASEQTLDGIVVGATLVERRLQRRRHFTKCWCTPVCAFRR
jgi:glycerate-2-kinase